MTNYLDSKRIFVAGHRGMVGSALLRRLARDGISPVVASRDVVDLRDQTAVRVFMEREAPDIVVVAAARVGGIYANSEQPASFIFDNLMIAANLIEASHRADVQKLLFLGSSCIYPRLAEQPIKEEALLTGVLEPTNEAYAIAKIAGIKLCQAYRRQYGRDFISCQPTNLYGPNDNFDLLNSHVLAALIRKAHEAKVSNASALVVWGTGAPRREFLHVDDLADACIFLLENYSGAEPVNIGWGKDISISEVAALVQKTVGFNGKIVYDHSKPDGAPRKLLDTSRINGLGWNPRIRLEDGLRSSYDWFLEHEAHLQQHSA